MDVILKKVRRIDPLSPREVQWKIRFTDGSSIVAIGSIPFNTKRAYGMYVEVFQDDKGRDTQYFFGKKVDENSVFLKEFFIMSSEREFGKTKYNCWKSFWPSSVRRIIDERSTGKPVFLDIDENGGIMPPLVLCGLFTCRKNIAYV